MDKLHRDTLDEWINNVQEKLMILDSVISLQLNLLSSARFSVNVVSS